MKLSVHEAVQQVKIESEEQSSGLNCSDFGRIVDNVSSGIHSEPIVTADTIISQISALWVAQ